MADFVVTLTDKGRQLEAQQTVYGYGFKIDHFVIGWGGHDPADPLVALPLNLEVTELPKQTFGPELIDEASLITVTCPKFVCVVQPREAVGGISNLGLIATILSVPAGSPSSAPEVGSTFLYAMTNFPLRTKTALSKETFNILLKT